MAPHSTPRLGPPTAGRRQADRSHAWRTFPLGQSLPCAAPPSAVDHVYLAPPRSVNRQAARRERTVATARRPGPARAGRPPEPPAICSPCPTDLKRRHAPSPPAPTRPRPAAQPSPRPASPTMHAAQAAPTTSATGSAPRTRPSARRQPPTNADRLPTEMRHGQRVRGMEGIIADTAHRQRSTRPLRRRAHPHRRLPPQPPTSHRPGNCPPSHPPDRAPRSPAGNPRSSPATRPASPKPVEPLVFTSSPAQNNPIGSTVSSGSTPRPSTPPPSPTTLGPAGGGSRSPGPRRRDTRLGHPALLTTAFPE